MAVRLFVGNLSYSTTEADLRTYFATVAPPSHVVLPVDRETGRPRGFAFVEFLDRAHAEQAIQKFNGQALNGRPLSVSEARAREDRGPGGPPRPGGPPGAPRPGGFSGPPRPGGFAPRPFDSGRRRAWRARGRAPQLRAGRQTAAGRQPEGQEEGRPASARSDSGEDRPPLLLAGRRLPGSQAGRFRRFRDQQAGEEPDKDDDERGA